MRKFFLLTALLIWLGLSGTVRAGILSLGSLSDVSGSRAKFSFYEEWGNDLQNVGWQLDYFSFGSANVHNQIVVRHINWQTDQFFYRAAPAEKLRIGLGLSLDNYYSQSQVIYGSRFLAHSVGFGNETLEVFVFGQDQGLGAAEARVHFGSTDRLVRGTLSGAVVQQDDYAGKNFFHAESAGVEVEWGQLFKLGYETANQLAGQQGSLLRLEAGKLETASVYWEQNQYQNGFIPRYVGRIYQNYYLSNQNPVNRNFTGQFSETGVKIAWGADNRIQIYQRQDQNQAWGGNLLWALNEAVFFEYEYEKPLPLYNLAFFQKAEFQRFRGMVAQRKDSQFVLQYQKMTDAAGLPSEELTLEYLLRL